VYYTTRDFLVDVLANYGNDPVRNVLPPVGGLEGPASVAASVSTDERGHTVYVTWEDVDLADVERYQIYLESDSFGLQGPYNAKKSPARILLPTNFYGPFTVRVQAVLINGLASLLSDGATASLDPPPPILQISSAGLYYPSGQSVIGSVTLTAGTATVPCPFVRTDSLIFLTNGTGWCRVSARVAGVSFTVVSSDSSDTSKIGYMVINPSS